MTIKLSGKLTAALAERAAAGVAYERLRANDAEQVPALRTALAEREQAMRAADLDEVPAIGVEVAGLRAAIGEAQRRLPTEEAIADARAKLKQTTARAERAAREQHVEAAKPHWQAVVKGLDAVFEGLDGVGDERADLALAVRIPVSDERYDAVRNAANALARALGLPLRPYCPVEAKRERDGAAQIRATKQAYRERDEAARPPVNAAAVLADLKAADGPLRRELEGWAETVGSLMALKRAGSLGNDGAGELAQAQAAVKALRERLAGMARQRREMEPLAERQSVVS